jgi:hypothetical protein
MALLRSWRARRRRSESPELASPSRAAESLFSVSLELEL